MMSNIFPLLIFNLFIIVMLAIDLLVFNRKAHSVSMKEAIGWSIFWVCLALLFNVFIYYDRGVDDALNFLTGYIVEKSLSVDNLFVFLLIFKYFKTPITSLHKVLFWGVLGAIILRALFIWLGIVLITSFHWIIYIFGLFLVVTGIKLWFEKEKEIDPDKNPVLKFFRFFIPFTKNYEHNQFFVIKDSRYVATPLFAVLLTIETTDLIFAVDSIPAILAITTDPFIVYTSNIFAILGLRSLFFVLSHIMSLFHFLHYGLSIILIFIGAKMLLADLYKVPTWAALTVIFSVLMISIIISLIFPQVDTKDS